MVGRGISKKLEDNYMFTMGDVARCSQYNEAKLYKLFGVNAELLIDRAWGREPTTIADVKAYRPSSNSLSMGQVLHKPYTLPKSITHSISIYDDSIVRQMVECIKVYHDGRLQIILGGGYELEEYLEK